MYASSSARVSSRENGTYGRSSTNSSATVAAVEQRVVGDEPVDARLAGEVARRVVTAAGRRRRRRSARRLAWLGRRRLGDRPRARPFEEVRPVEAVLGVDVGLDTEEVLRVPQVGAELLGHLGGRREQIAEGVRPGADDRVVGIRRRRSARSRRRRRRRPSRCCGRSWRRSTGRCARSAARCRCAARTGTGWSSCRRRSPT